MDRPVSTVFFGVWSVGGALGVGRFDSPHELVFPKPVIILQNQHRV